MVGEAFGSQMLLTILYLRVLCIQTLWILCKYIHTASTTLYRVKYYIYEVKWNCQSMIKWSWQLKYSCLDSITSSSTENPLLLLHSKNLPKYNKYIVVSYCHLCHIYGNSRSPIFHFTYKTARMLAYLILMWYEAWSQSTIKGVLLSACITPIYFSVLWMLTFTCFLKLMLWLWIVLNSLISLLKTLSGWPVLFRFGTYRI